MTVNRPDERSTAVFCRSREDGTVAPYWDDSREQQLAEEFDVGLVIDDRYLLLKKLGQGAMGRVFLARDERLDRHVALKVVCHEIVDQTKLEQVLKREARLGANLNHRGIASVFDFGFHGDKSYTVFEYVEGETLRQLINRRQKLSIDETASIVSDLAEALDFAHAAGVIHRDLKPENICINRQGEFKILDLGIARDARQDFDEGVYAGTPAYSSPEQAGCLRTDGKSDQYALGLIAYELVSGHRAFQANSVVGMLASQMELSPTGLRQLDSRIPAEFEKAIFRAIEKSPDDRFATCQEFAGELAKICQTRQSKHSILTAPENRICFYVAHVAEESLLAKQVCQRLEDHNYSCWLFGRDAVPGIAVNLQVEAALQRSQATVLLLSQHALRNRDFRREIEYARKLDGPVIPVLIELGEHEFKLNATDWSRLLGTCTYIEYGRDDAIDEVQRKILKVARQLRLSPADTCPSRRKEYDPSCIGQSWATDANQIDIHDLPRVLFENSTVSDFLNHRHRHFVSATKGFGKTLLLTRKRQMLTGASANSSVTMIPEGRPFLDFMSEMRSLSANYEKPLSELSTTKRIWSAALRIACISHHPHVINENESYELRAFSPRVQSWLSGAKIQPTVVFKELSSLRVSELNRLIDNTENFLDQKIRLVHGATMIFIDKVDQAMRHLSREAWIAIQAGLIEAAWDLMSANSHIKVFASIRQEAFANYESDIKSNLFSATTSINYSEDELKGLLDQLAECYEGCRTFSQFVGFNVVRNRRKPAPDDSFQFARRYTFGRPRDLVALASELSSRKFSLNENVFKEVVRRISSSVLVANIFDEVRIFLNCLGDRDARIRFLQLIPANILSRGTTVSICEKYNGLESGSFQHFAESLNELHHPFFDLYTAGLLGVVELDRESGNQIQVFRKPHEPFSHSRTKLPDSPVYLIHPALTESIATQRADSEFSHFQHIVVGDGVIWEPYFPLVMQIEDELASVDHPRFEETVHQLIRQIESRLANRDGKTTAMADIRSGQLWQDAHEFTDVPECADALFWLDELLVKA